MSDDSVESRYPQPGARGSRSDRSPSRAVRIRDVAEVAGVSPATVSRVLNDNVRVNDQLRAKVEAAVAQLGYRPNRLGAHMRRQQTRMVGLVVSDIENPHHTKFIASVEDRVRELGYHLLLCSTGESATHQADYLRMLHDERVAGVLLSPSDPDGPEIAALLDDGIPIVAIDRSVSDHRADSVVMNNFAGTYVATRMLIAAGHRSIGFISGPLSVESGAERLTGFRDAMAEAGLSPVWRQGAFRQETAEIATRELLESEAITALVIANNLMALGSLAAIRSRGARVPDDVAVVAIDDPFWAALVEPPLTTLAQPIEELALTATDLVVERIRGRHDKPVRRVFEFELRRRRSCGTADKVDAAPTPRVHRS